MTRRDELHATLDTGFERLACVSLRRAVAANAIPDIAGLPFSLRVLLENALAHLGQNGVGADQARAIVTAGLAGRAGEEVAFHPGRVMMPDSSGLPLLADLAAMRDALAARGGDPLRINPVRPVDLVVDHSVSVDVAGRSDALARNVALEFARNGERYEFLKWAQGAFDNLRIVPPGVGICHQVNLEYLARVVLTREVAGQRVAMADTLVGGDSHTPMVNALGVLGWGVGGIEAIAAMLGEPLDLRVPEVIGCRLIGRLRPGVTATDLVLTATERLRARGVVQTFVEFCGPGLAALALPDRATLANMAPEYGATVGFFPVDAETLRYLRLTGRDAAHVALVEAHAREQGLWRDPAAPEPRFADVVEIDLDAIEPSLAGPRRPQDRVALSRAPASLPVAPGAGVAVAGRDFALRHGDVAIAAITSCTNTSNPGVMLAAGLLARRAVERGLRSKPWVKTSLAPGSRAVAQYLEATGLQRDLDALGFQVVGFGCTTCLGNSGPLDPAVEAAVVGGDLTVAAVLSGNRNFEGRVHRRCKVAYLASPPLVVAYALAGSMNIDLTREALAVDAEGRPVYLRDLWPPAEEVAALLGQAMTRETFARAYRGADDGTPEWAALAGAKGARFAWRAGSTFIRRPPFLAPELAVAPADIRGARALLMLGDSITTDHISPVSAIPADSLAGAYLLEQGVAAADAGSYAARRVNHDVMARGAFAHPRLRNELVADREGPFTRHQPSGEVMSVFAAGERYRREGVPLVIVAGREYGTGSSRDWAAKGTLLLGVRAVIAESVERIHRSNLVGMGVLPLELPAGVTRRTLGLDGGETFDILGVADGLRPRMTLTLRIHGPQATREVPVLCRLDTRREVAYVEAGGLLPSVLGTMAEAAV